MDISSCRSFKPLTKAKGSRAMTINPSPGTMNPCLRASPPAYTRHSMNSREISMSEASTR